MPGIPALILIVGLTTVLIFDAFVVVLAAIALLVFMGEDGVTTIVGVTVGVTTAIGVVVDTAGADCIITSFVS